MANDSTTQRRWFGAAVLVLAVAMLALGETVLKDRLGSVTFVVYWLVCILLTSVAILLAALDLRALRRRTGQEHQDLLRDTFEEIESRAKGAPDKPANTQPAARQRK